MNHDAAAERGQQGAQAPRDLAVADDADGAGAQLPAGAHLRLLSRPIDQGAAREAAREVDDGADDPFRHRIHEAGRRLRDEDAGFASGGDVDVADVDGDAAHRGEIRRRLEQGARPRRGAVEHGDMLAPGRSRQLGFRQGMACRIEGDVGHLAHRRERLLAEILGEDLRADGSSGREAASPHPPGTPWACT